jgi:hypothetical protein
LLVARHRRRSRLFTQLALQLLTPTLLGRRCRCLLFPCHALLLLCNLGHLLLAVTPPLLQHSLVRCQRDLELHLSVLESFQIIAHCAEIAHTSGEPCGDVCLQGGQTDEPPF